MGWRSFAFSVPLVEVILLVLIGCVFQLGASGVIEFRLQSFSQIISWYFVRDLFLLHMSAGLNSLCVPGTSADDLGLTSPTSVYKLFGVS